MIQFENRPLRYFLSSVRLSDAEPAMELWLHDDLLANPVFSALSPEDRRIRSLQSDLECGPFQVGFEEGSGFGFDGMLRVGRRSGSFQSLVVPVPVCEFEDGSCRHCEGEERERQECFFCNRSGKDTRIDYQQLFVVLATMIELLERSVCDDVFSGDRLPDAAIKPPFQLLMIEALASKADSRFGVGGRYGIPMVDWLRRFPDHTSLQPVVQAMMQVETRIFPLSFDGEKFSFRAVAEQGGWLNISCRGDACGLHPTHHGIQAGRGYEFSCHNVDHPGQVMVLLAALGALTDMALEAGAGT